MINRERIYKIIDSVDEHDKLSIIYNYFMLAVIIISLIPLAFKKETQFLYITDKVTVIIFIIDYLLHWMTADYKYSKKSVLSFLRYPFSAMAIVDLLSILPSLKLINNGFKVLRILRMIKSMRVFRVLKAMRYSKNYLILKNVLVSSKESLVAVGALAVGYILISALIILNVEPDSFNNFFEAVYWATVSLTTVGYGDIYPVTTMGRIVSMISTFFGIAIVALPAGIISAGYMNEINIPHESENTEITDNVSDEDK